MITNKEKRERQASTTIRDQNNPNVQLENIRYEDHFLMFRRAGNHAPYLQKVIDYTDGTTVEFGCGTGTQALAVEPYVERSIGVELDMDRSELTYQRGRRMDALTQFICGDMFELPFTNNAVSTAFKSGVFQHFDNTDIQAIIEEGARIARDHLILSVANRWYPKRPENKTRRMKSHEWWCDRLNSCPSVSLEEDGTYGNRLDAGYRAVTLRRSIWFGRWLSAGIPYPRSWFVLDTNG